MNGDNSTCSSGHCSMDRDRDEMEVLRTSEMDECDVVSVLAGTTALSKSAVPAVTATSAEAWLRMSLLNVEAGAGDKAGLGPWLGGRGVGSDSGLGPDESANLGRLSNKSSRRSNVDSLLPKPPSYWKFAILVTLINPPFGLLALFMCYMTKKDVDRGHLCQAKRRSKWTLYTVVAGFSLAVIALVMFVVIGTARNVAPFRMEPSVTVVTNGHDSAPPPPPRIENKGPMPMRKRPFQPLRRPSDSQSVKPAKPAEPVEDVLGALEKHWGGVNASTFNFAQHDEIIPFLESMDSNNKPNTTTAAA